MLTMPEKDHALHLVSGRAGRLMPFIIREIGKRHAAGRSSVLLVPQQYTLEAERTLIRELKLPGMIDIEVLSPGRLIRRVREAVGTGGRHSLDAMGRNMAISCALNREREQLEYYKGTADQPGLAAKMSALLGDIQRTGLLPAELFRAADSHSGAAAQKERDIARIWQTYEEILAGRFADTHQQTMEAAQRLAESGVLKDTGLFVYGFDLLQPEFCALLGESLATTELTVVTMVLDDTAEDKRIFAGQSMSAQELDRVLKSRGREMVRHSLPPEQVERAPELSHLERELFTWGHKPYQGQNRAIRIRMAANPYLESRAVAAQLLRWHDQGIAWGAMAVTLAVTTSGLEGILTETLRAAGIPYYSARKDHALRHGLCRMLICGVRAAADGFHTQDVLGYAASGFSGFTALEAAELKNIARAYGLRYGKWLRPIAHDSQDEAAERAEMLRGRAVAPLEKLQQAMKQAATAAESAEAVYGLLKDGSAYEQLCRQEEELVSRGMMAEATRNRQIWRLCLSILDDLHSLLGGEKTEPEMICRLIEAGLTEAEISGLPPEPDVVTIGEAGHLMTGDVQAMVMMGMQSTEENPPVSLLTERERADLSHTMQMQIGLTRSVQNAMRQADLYRTMALPSEQLLLTFSTGNQAGGLLLPSGLIQDIQRMFAIETEGSAVAGEERDFPLSPELAMDELGSALQGAQEGGMPEQTWLQAMRWLWQSPVWQDRTRRVFGAMESAPRQGKLTSELAGKIFSGDITSISRLERFAECPYRHFLDYGLRLQQPEEFKFDALDQGTFYHEVLERFAGSTQGKWQELDDDRIEKLLDRAVEEASDSWQNGPLTEDGLGKIQGEEAVRKVRNTVWACTRQLRNSRFVPLQAEVEFGTADENSLPGVILTLADGRRVSLRGKIDRVDTYQASDGGVYLRVTDYKSGDVELKPEKIWHGLQLQLMLYLRAAASGCKSEPAGAMYMRIQDPSVTGEKGKEQQELASEMRMQGYILAEPEIVAAMDRDEPNYSFPAVLNANGSLKKNAKGVDRRQMKGMLNRAYVKAREFSGQIHSGVIAAEPARLNGWDACQYCSDKEACTVRKFRDLEKNQPEDLMEAMASEAEK